jgi:hypothetical protein
LLLRVSAIIFLLTFPAADSPQEGMGFEPSVPRVPAVASNAQRAEGRPMGLRGMRNAHLAAKEFHLHDHALAPNFGGTSYFVVRSERSREMSKSQIATIRYRTSAAPRRAQPRRNKT